VREVYERTRRIVAQLGTYRYEHIFIDNNSKDGTLSELRAIAREDHNVKVIANTRNFGHIRSPIHAFKQAAGDVVVFLMSDLQDPPELIADLLAEWERGIPIVIAAKDSSDESQLMFWIRKRYYKLINYLSEVPTFENFTGFGLYDRKVVEMIRSMEDPYPYFRGMIAEVGLPHTIVKYHQGRRKRGITKNNFYTLYDLAMLGITNLSKVPLRVVTFTGFACSLVCLLAGLTYLVYKLLFWNNFSVGIAPLVIGIFFFGSVQMLCMGILGEYIGSIHTFVQRRPLVFERERINFEYGHGEPASSQEMAASANPGSQAT
jgi:glycosyltransferase involved in cell wall biosynthesis